MKLITRLDNAAFAESRWYRNYSHQSYCNTASICGRTKREIHEELVALGPNPSPAQVEEVIGNTSWTSCVCHECGKSVEEMVQIGQEPDYESATAEICFPCLKKAVKMKAKATS
jgi:hypothetical protein